MGETWTEPIMCADEPFETAAPAQGGWASQTVNFVPKKFDLFNRGEYVTLRYL